MHTNLYFWVLFAIYNEQLAVFKMGITGSAFNKELLILSLWILI